MQAVIHFLFLLFKKEEWIPLTNNIWLLPMFINVGVWVGNLFFLVIYPELILVLEWLLPSRVVSLFASHEMWQLGQAEKFNQNARNSVWPTFCRLSFLEMPLTEYFSAETDVRFFWTCRITVRRTLNLCEERWDMSYLKAPCSLIKPTQYNFILTQSIINNWWNSNLLYVQYIRLNIKTLHR